MLFVDYLWWRLQCFKLAVVVAVVIVRWPSTVDVEVDLVVAVVSEAAYPLVTCGGYTGCLSLV